MQLRNNDLSEEQKKQKQLYRVLIILFTFRSTYRDYSLHSPLYMSFKTFSYRFKTIIILIFCVILVLILIFNFYLCLLYLDHFSEDGHYVDRNVLKKKYKKFSKSFYSKSLLKYLIKYTIQT